MADTPTLDPGVVIEAIRKGANPYLVYRRISTGERWRVSGTCNQCGLCVIGAARTADYAWSGPPGTPMAVADVRTLLGRLDEPITLAFPADMEQQAAVTPTATVSGCALTVAPEP